jgi:hypothetical protein
LVLFILFIVSLPARVLLIWLIWHGVRDWVDALIRVRDVVEPCYEPIDNSNRTFLTSYSWTRMNLFYLRNIRWCDQIIVWILPPHNNIIFGLQFRRHRPSGRRQQVWAIWAEHSPGTEVPSLSQCRMYYGIADLHGYDNRLLRKDSKFVTRVV